MSLLEGKQPDSKITNIVILFALVDFVKKIISKVLRSNAARLKLELPASTTVASRSRLIQYNENRRHSLLKIPLYFLS